MAKEIVAWCDRHLKRGERVPGRERRISIDGRNAVALDLCDPCDEETLGPVREMLKEFGQPIVAARTVAGGGDVPTFTCTVCGRAFIKRGSWRNHMRKVHSMSAAQVDSAVSSAAENPDPSDTTPPAEPVHSPIPLPFECPQCQRRFEKKQGLNMHQMRTHGQLQGDPKKLDAAS